MTIFSFAFIGWPHHPTYSIALVNGRADLSEGVEIGLGEDKVRRGMAGRFGQELAGRFGNPRGGSPKLRRSQVRQGQASLS